MVVVDLLKRRSSLLREIFLSQRLLEAVEQKDEDLTLRQKKMILTESDYSAKK